MTDTIGEKKDEKSFLSDSQLAELVREADVVVLLREGGIEASTFVKGVGPVPLKWDVSYGEKDDPPQTIRHFSIRGGWTRAEWRKLDRSALKGDTSGDDVPE